MAEVANVLSIPRALRLFQRKKLPALCAAGNAVGDCVYVFGPKIGTNYQVRKAFPSVSSLMPSVGVLVSKSAPTVCTVQVFGELTGVFSGFTPGRALYVGDAGVPSHTPGVIAQVIGFAFSTDVIFVNPELSGDTRNFKTGRPLIATGDPRIWTTPEIFQHEPGGTTIEVFHSSRRLEQAASASPATGDYVVEESTPGLGFDTVHLVSFTPNVRSVLRANYLVGVI